MNRFNNKNKKSNKKKRIKMKIIQLIEIQPLFHLMINLKNKVYNYLKKQSNLILVRIIK